MPTDDLKRPRTRAGCAVEGACPFVSCRHHLLLDVTDQGALHTIGQRAISLRMKSFQDWAENAATQVDMAKYTCSLDVADDGEHTLDEIGKILGVTRERVRQIENRAMEKLRKSPAKMRALREAAIAARYAAGHTWGAPEDLTATKSARAAKVRLSDATLDLIDDRLR